REEEVFAQNGPGQQPKDQASPPWREVSSHPMLLCSWQIGGHRSAYSAQRPCHYRPFNTPLDPIRHERQVFLSDLSKKRAGLNRTGPPSLSAATRDATCLPHCHVVTGVKDFAITFPRFSIRRCSRGRRCSAWLNQAIRANVLSRRSQAWTSPMPRAAWCS